MYRAIAGILVVGLIGCDTAPVGDLPAAADPAVPGENLTPDQPPVECLTTYFNGQADVGFNPPPGLSGPELQPFNEQFPSVVRTWRWLGTDVLDDVFILLFSYIPTEVSLTWGMSLEEIGRFEADFVLAEWETLFQNHSITLDSGQPAWVLATTYPPYPRTGPDTRMSVQVILLWNGRKTTLHLFGDIDDGTYDYDRLLGIGRTLCAE